jgi:hypothetical protein
MADLLIVFPILLAFLPLAAYLTSGVRAYLASPVLSVLGALFAGFAHILLDVPIAGAWLLLALLQAILFIPRGPRERIIQNLAIAQTDVYSIAVLGLGLLLSAMAAITTPAPLAWDARSIWFHHAKWLNGPAEYFLEAQYLPAGNWPDYPFTGPAVMTLSWQLSGGAENFWLASRIVGVFVLLVGIFAGYLLAERFAAKAHFGFKLAGILLLSTSLTLLADGYFNAGYQDALQAALVGLVFVSVLSLKDSSWRDLLPPAAAFLLAANIKQEGFWFATGALLLALAIQAFDRNLKPLALIAVPIGFRAIWSAFQDFVGMPDNGHTAEVIERFPLLFSGDAEVASNLQLVFSNGIQPRSMNYLLLVALAAVILVALGRTPSLGKRFALGAVAILAPYGVLFVAVVTYVLGQSGGLEWWLGTSYTRITATFEFLSLLTIVMAAFSLLPEARPKVVVSQKPVSKKAKKKR